VLDNSKLFYALKNGKNNFAQNSDDHRHDLYLQFDSGDIMSMRCINGRRNIELAISVVDVQVGKYGI
jgi:hypothetical protein